MPSWKLACHKQLSQFIYLFLLTNNSVPVILFSYLEKLRGGRKKNPKNRLVTWSSFSRHFKTSYRNNSDLLWSASIKEERAAFNRQRLKKKGGKKNAVACGDRSLVSVLHALVPPELTPWGANEISMFIQMYFPSPPAHSDMTCVNMWLHTSAAVAGPEITAAQIEFLFVVVVLAETLVWECER